MSSTAVTEDIGSSLINLNICLITFSTIFIVTRCYVRTVMLKSVSWDDAFALVAWIVLLAQSILEIVEVGYGTGRHIQDVPPGNLPRFFATLSTLELLYFAATCFVRLSVVAVIPRISREKQVMRVVWALGSVIVILSAVCFMVLLFECKHIPDLWNKQNPTAQCASPQREVNLFWSHASLGICIDVALLVFPIWLIYSRMMFSSAAVKVILVFGVGSFVLVTGIVRLVIIVSVDFATDTTWKLTKLSTWADLEGHIGLWVACFPSLPPLIRLVARKVGLRSSSLSKGSANLKTTTNNAWESKARGYVKSGPDVNLRGDQSSVFDDDSSTKKFVSTEENDVGGMEMGHIRCTTKIVMVDERGSGTDLDSNSGLHAQPTTNVYSGTTKSSRR